MSKTWIWQGSRWWKFDFHAHTPASEDYGKGPHQVDLKSRTPEEWLLDYMRAGIDCVVVTDHNTGAWIDDLKAALKKMQIDNHPDFRPLVLFPGVELSINGGVHLLAILDPSKTASDVDTLLGLVEYEGTKGRSDGVTRRSFPDVVQKIDQAGGIAIPAHVDGDSGLFKLAGNTLSAALNSEPIHAIEVVDPSSQKPQLYQEKKLRWTEVLGSDSHHPHGNAGQSYPGSRFTWVKMGTPSLEGLRLALIDGQLSVRRSDQVSGDPNQHGDIAIESIEVRNARYMGRSRAYSVGFNPWFNAIIGGRGTGKSTLVEFIRIALHRDNELPDTLKKDFEKYNNTYYRRADNGLLTDETTISIYYRKDRTRFRILWHQGGDPVTIEVEDENGKWSYDQGDVAQRFPVRIFSQKQIFELAKAPLALLRIVDDAREVGRRSWDEEWNAEETRYLSLRAKTREIESGLADETRILGELEDVKRKISIFEQASYADVLKEYQKRSREQKEVHNWESSWAGLADRLREVASSIVPNPLETSLSESNTSENQDLLVKAKQILEKLKEIQQKLEVHAEEAEAITRQWLSARDDSDWNKAVIASIHNYEKLIERLKAEEVGDTAAYRELVARYHELEEKLTNIEVRRDELKKVQIQASKSLDKLAGLRRNLTQRRKRFLDEVLADNPYVRIDVIPYGAREMAEIELRRLLQREAGGFEKDIRTIIEEIYPIENDAGSIEDQLKKAKTKLHKIVEGRFEGPLSDKRFETHIRKLPPEVFDRINTWFPEDSLRVEYSTSADGSGFRAIQEGSPGQKTAALLAFLFSYGEEPIILDQPEDDLDNRLIYDLIVQQLRAIKRQRQVIVVTHNANIVVNGDAELVIPLAARGGESQLDGPGCLQERSVRDSICNIMEGGREALELRYRRITLE